MISTSFSFRASYGSPEEAVARLKEIGWKDAPIADTTTFGVDLWNDAATKAGLKPIFGARIAVSASIQSKKPNVDFFTILAKEDLRPVNELIEKATSQFRYLPQLSYEDLAAAKGVFKTTGSKPKLDELDPSDPDLFVGLSVATSKGLFNAAVKRGFKFIALQDNQYATPDQRFDYETACGRGANLQVWPQHILSDKEWAQEIYKKRLHNAPIFIETAIENRDDIFAECNATLKRGTLVKPPREKTLRQMCEAGAAKLGISLEGEYGERLDMELSVIADKGFEDYFYLVGDLMAWARQNMLCGAGRGSSAGSLVCYLLDITKIDPIKYNLLFWRFIDPNRGGWQVKKDFKGFA